MEIFAGMQRFGTTNDGREIWFADEKFDNPGLIVMDPHDRDTVPQTFQRFVPAPPSAQAKLRVEIENAINRHSAENGSDTPDFILAHFLIASLHAFDVAVRQREAYYGREIDPTPYPAVMPLFDGGEI